MNSLEDIIEFTILYLQMRNVQNWKWVGYKVFKNIISYATGIKSIDMIRTIFEKILTAGYIEKRKVGSATEYRFLYEI